MAVFDISDDDFSDNDDDVDDVDDDYDDYDDDVVNVDDADDADDDDVVDVVDDNDDDAADRGGIKNLPSLARGKPLRAAALVPASKQSNWKISSINHPHHHCQQLYRHMIILTWII